MSDQPIDFAGALVNNRSEELSKEFREHQAEFIRRNPTMTDSNVIFQGWVLQKLAGLQLVAEQNDRRINQLASRK